jgi:hypothetical protein
LIALVWARRHATECAATAMLHFATLFACFGAIFSEFFPKLSPGLVVDEPAI